MNDQWNDYWKEWVNNKIYLLSTPIGMVVATASLIIGVVIGKFVLHIN